MFLLESSPKYVARLKQGSLPVSNGKQPWNSVVGASGTGR